MSVPRPASSSIPDQPGCYLFRDGDGRVIYVGKATSLRKRLANYWSRPLHPRTEAMTQSAESVEWMLASGEVDALMLEYNLIQTHRPRFNIRYRDDKSYPYLALTVGETWPRAQVLRGAKRKKVRYFGPYAHAWAIRDTLDALTRVFPVRTCSNAFFDQRARAKRPCLYFDIGRCAGPCVPEVSGVTEESYREHVDAMADFLAGNPKQVLRRLEAEMDAAAARQEYEQAAKLRDQLSAARRAMESQEMVLTQPEDLDIIGLAEDDLEAAFQVFIVRGGRVLGRKGWVADRVEELSRAELLGSIVRQLYMERDDIPPRVLVPGIPDGQQVLEQWLSQRRGSRVSIGVPERGAKRKLLEVVTRNADEAFHRHKLRRASDFGARSRALADLSKHLGLEQAPLRIECYDISNLGATDKVGSMVVFEDGLPKRSDYRRFQIKGVAGQDDFASMEEMLRRRFTRLLKEQEEGPSPGRRFSYPPALVVVDGGRGQLSMASKVLADLGLQIPHIGLAKRLEEVYFPDTPEPLLIPRGSEALFVLQHLRDEAHRFAITYHRQKREKRALASPLDDIPGVGPGRKKALLKRFGSLTRLRAAEVEEIAATPGIGPEVARAVYDGLHTAPSREGLAGMPAGVLAAARRAPDMPDATILPMPPGEGPRPATGFTLITGLSGAGRSEAAHSLEDLGFFVVDNLPPALLGKMAELVSRPGGPTRVAIVVDARGGVFFGELSKALEELKQEHVDYRIVFLEAADDDLVNRYEATRRRHPLAPADRVVEGIRKERLMMESLRGDADLIIDTSGLTPHGLRDRIREAFADAPPESGLQVSIQSFGFKYGSPRDADLVFDVRFLPNPHWVEELRPLPGTEQPVRDYVQGQPQYEAFMERLEALLDVVVPGYVAEGKSYLTVAVGCTGGRHRSVVVAEELGAFLSGRGMPVSVTHRDLRRP